MVALGSNWNLEMLIFTEGEKPDPEKNPRGKERTNK
jgi:hypothetical protein